MRALLMRLPWPLRDKSGAKCRSRLLWRIMCAVRLVCAGGQRLSSGRSCSGVFAALIGVAISFLIPASGASHVGKAKSETPAELFAKPAVHDVSLELSKLAVHSLAGNPRKHVPAVAVIDGRRYTEVEVHLKGSIGSFRGLEDKPGLTLSFVSAKPSERFDTLKKFHLNNSVQDPTYLSELMCTEMFRAAGVPAPHVTHAWVKLNGRVLGLYVLEESYNHDFLASYFKNTRGNIYGQSAGADVTEPLERVQGDGENTHEDLKKLADAAMERDPQRRWERLQQVLDVDRFLSFMAMEVLLCHWDGYTFSRHNYRVYHDVDQDKMVFFPHDLDQVLGDANTPIIPDGAALVSQAVVSTPEGRRLYRQRFGTIFTNVFQPAVLNHRIDTLVQDLRPALASVDPALADGLAPNARSLKERIIERAKGVQQQLQRPEPEPIRFENGLAKIAAWQARTEKGAVDLEQVTLGNLNVLHLKCGQGGGIGSWRSAVLLEPGTYRLHGRAKAKGVTARTDIRGSGGGLRISGQQRQNKVVGDTDWVELNHDFAVEGGVREVSLVCELRADAGEIWFDLDSLQLVRIR